MSEKQTIRLFDAANHIIPTPKKIIWGDYLECFTDYALSVEECPEEVAVLYRKEFDFRGNGDKYFHLTKDVGFADEAYMIRIERGAVTVKANSERGFFYALMTLKQLREGDYLPLVEIEDAPALPLRGFHMSLENLRQTRAEDVRRILRSLAKFKFNTVVLEYADRFSFINHPEIASSNAFTMAEINDFEKIAEEHYLDVIPLCQSLGHFGYVLRHDKYRHLLEEDMDGKPREQLCPSKPESLELFKSMASELMNAHPNGRYFHIGADETGSLGRCPTCAAIAKKEGRGNIYINHINNVCAWLKSQGRIPILWDDMLSRHPEIVERLDKDAVIMYWDYWTTSLNSPIVVARGSAKGITHDIRWENEWQSELSEVEWEVVTKFSRGFDLENELTTDYLERFGDYLGKEFPKRMTGFPYLRYFQDKGFNVIAAPTTLGNRMDETFGLPNYNRFLGNIRSFAQRSVQEKASGLVTCSWYNFPPEILDLGIMATGQYSWTGVV